MDASSMSTGYALLKVVFALGRHFYKSQCFFSVEGIVSHYFKIVDSLGVYHWEMHCGDGVFYGFESDRRVIIGDIHEDGRYLYPGTGDRDETGTGDAVGTKLNVPLDPSSGDEKFIQAFDEILAFVSKFKPQFILLQCGADGLAGDPITHQQYSARAHHYATMKLHKLSHEMCDGRFLAMGGGGYNPSNVEKAWMSVIKALSDDEEEQN